MRATLRNSPLMDLTFRDEELEADFAAYFGYRCRLSTFLLSAVMTVVWTTRLSSIQSKSLPYASMLSAIYSSMTFVHAFSVVIILVKASVCCSETRKAKIWVLDAAACMFTVILFVEREDWTLDGAKPSLLLMSSPIVVYSIHGWSVPFAGFRLAADLCLHALNLQVYITMKFQQEWARADPTDMSAVVKTGCALFCFNSIIPLVVNLLYEAQVRSAFLAQRRLSQQKLRGFWLTVLKYSFYTEVPA